MLKRRHCTAIWFFCTLLLPALLSSALHAQTFQVLYTFHGPNGDRPLGQLTLDVAGNIYGTTAEGDRNLRDGLRDRVPESARAANCWDRIVSMARMGPLPEAGLLLDSAGSLFGTTENGGNYNQNCGGASGLGCGVVFRLTPKGKETVYKFTGNGPIFPSGNLVQDAAGNLYGTTIWSGRSGGGTVFKLDQSGKLTVLQGLPSRECTALALSWLVTTSMAPPRVTIVNSHTYSRWHRTGATQRSEAAPADPSILTVDGAGNLYGDTSDVRTSVMGQCSKSRQTLMADGLQTTLYKFCQLPPDARMGSFHVDRRD